MNRPARNSCRWPSPINAFTLIELIGVMAIMAIMASVLVPNVLRSIDRAAVAAEVQTLHHLGAQVKLYLQANAQPPITALPPATPNWSTQLATYADLNPADVATNRRQVARTYVLEPVTSPLVSPRAMIISSMRSELAPPAAASINTFARFDDIWQTADGQLPTGASAGLWAGWSAVDGSGEYLLIERINLQGIYKSDFATFTVVLVNKSVSKAVSYQLVLAGGAVQPVVNLPFSVAGTGSSGSSGGGSSSGNGNNGNGNGNGSGNGNSGGSSGGGSTGGSGTPFVSTTPPVTITMSAKDRLNLYSQSGALSLDFSYTGGTSNKTFYFTDTGGWLPP
jgi:type II secretory pathway pseudopilin PulG